MDEFQQSNETISFDEITNGSQNPDIDRPKIDPGAHILQILGTDFYRNNKDNLIAKLWVKSKTQSDADSAKVFITLMKGREPQIKNQALCKQVMGSTGVTFPNKAIDAPNLTSLEGATFWAETEWNGDFLNISNPKPVDNEFKTPAPAAEPETKDDADEDFADDIPF
jgi:hypothetical protein